VYQVRERVWSEAALGSDGGRLCIGCLEKRLGRKLRPKDFQKEHPFNTGGLPCTERLRNRQKRVNAPG
jgi:hypothetical protein